MSKFTLLSFPQASKRTNRLSFLLWGSSYHRNNLFHDDLDLALQEKAIEAFDDYFALTYFNFEELRIAVLYELAKESKNLRTKLAYLLLQHLVPVRSSAALIAKEALKATRFQAPNII
ncbi:TPA: hypothetical protein ACF4EV_002166 [Vibrio parahaemolyticus]